MENEPQKAQPLSDIDSLIDKLRKVEALFAGAASDGERAAAGNALDKIRHRLEREPARDPPVEFTFRLVDGWQRKLFIALCRRYGLSPYRYAGQRRTTVLARVPKSFVEKTLWPEFRQISRVLNAFLDDITTKVIQEHIFADASEPAVARPAIPDASRDT